MQPSIEPNDKKRGACDSCKYVTELTEFPIPEPRRDGYKTVKRLCWLCANSAPGNTRADQNPNIEVLRHINMMTNAVLDAIAGRPLFPPYPGEEDTDQ